MEIFKSFYLENKKFIDVILMDIQMPLLSGYEASAEIRKFMKLKNPNLKTIIIAISTNNDYEKKNLK